jgi:putative alpha-1,2-mannosidase
MKLPYCLFALTLLTSITFAQHQNPSKVENQLLYTGENKKMPVDDVYPYIGTINPKTRSTVPVIKVPGGNIGLFPAFTPEMEDLYLADKIYGFPLAFGSLMINTGKLKTGARVNASAFDHDLEIATPYYYQVLLEDPVIAVEFTITENTVIFRFARVLLYPVGVEIQKSKIISLRNSVNRLPGSLYGKTN